MIELEDILEYRKQNRRRHKNAEAAKKYRQRNKPKKLTPEQRTKSRERAREWHKNNNLSRYKSAEEIMLTRTKHRAKRAGIEHTISLTDITIPKQCPVLGIELSVGRSCGKGPLDDSPSLDRIDNSKGYIPGNVIVVSNRANRLKGDSTLQELELILAFYKSFTNE